MMINEARKLRSDRVFLNTWTEAAGSIEFLLGPDLSTKKATCIASDRSTDAREGVMPEGCNEALLRERISYEQNFQHVRALIPVTYQIPALAITITGGLWFGVLQTKSIPAFGYLFLALACIMNVGFFLIMWRLGQIIGIYLDALKDWHPPSYVTVFENPKVTQWPHAITVFQLFFLGAAAFSLVGIYLLVQHPIAG